MNLLFLYLLEITLLFYLNRYELSSDIIGTSIACGREVCATSNLNLAQPVQIEFQHSESLAVSSKIIYLSLGEAALHLQIQLYSSVNSYTYKDSLVDTRKDSI